MKVKYLDIQTGRVAEVSGINEWDLIEGNYSCDCNRAIAFGDIFDSDNYEKCSLERYIVIGIEKELSESILYNETEIIKEANREYYYKLSTYDKEKLKK